MKISAAYLLAVCAVAQAGDWSPAVDVRHDDELCVAYQARVDGPYLVVRATLGPGWHTFAMDNKVRAEEKLAGKPAISIDRATEITAGGGLETAGPWYQTPPKDFSRPELRWFSWGFDRQAQFVTKVRRAGGAASTLTLKGQACTEKICKNVEVSIAVPAAKAGAAAASSTDLKELVQVR
jgi:DsbC/DsbD-like thiol-disulfide interchange protein